MHVKTHECSRLTNHLDRYRAGRLGCTGVGHDGPVDGFPNRVGEALVAVASGCSMRVNTTPIPAA